MRTVFANILGDWTEITDGDTLDCLDPVSWVKEGGLEKSEEFGYVNVQHNGENYRMHISQIQVLGG